MRRRSRTALGALAALVIALAAAAPPAGAAPPADNGKININSAGVDELVTLPGIGKAYAERIIEYREKNGPFKMIDDLKNVSGIGDKTLQDLRDKVTVGEE